MPSSLQKSEARVPTIMGKNDELAGIQDQNRTLSQPDPDALGVERNKVAEPVSSEINDSAFLDITPQKCLPVYSPNGKGSFGIVYEVISIGDGKFFEEDHSYTSRDHSQSTLHIDLGINESLQSSTNLCTSSELAVKKCRSDLEDKEMLNGLIDTAYEAKLLAALKHPNIVRLQATAGTPGKADFMLILDRLHKRLDQQIPKWKIKTRQIYNIFDRRKSRQSKSALFSERILVLCHVARALRYLHEKRIIHRDLKSENVAYDIHGDAKIFDLGLAKQLQPKDLIHEPEDYLYTGMTGSMRWMAPEIYLHKPYGPSADVYSFGLLFWNVFALKIPYGKKITARKFVGNVIINGERPKELPFLPSCLHDLMTSCWDIDRSKRPSFELICKILETHIYTNIG